jgi:hypothetical protein
VGAAGHAEQPEPIRPVGLDHVQVAAPPGSENAARRFYTADPWGNRIELVASA